MKNILIIRSANMPIIDKLINYIRNKNQNINFKLFCLIQRSSVLSFKEKYPFITYIEKEDGFFSYRNFKINKELKEMLNSIGFDEIYIPSSSEDFIDFEETLLIVGKIKTKKNILFNCYEETFKNEVNFYSIWFDIFFGKIIYIIKILCAVIGIIMIYVIGSMYYFIKNKLFDKL